MTQQIINIGAAPNDGTGDALRLSFDKCNLNFTELYNGVTASLPIGNAIQYEFNNGTTEPPAAGEIRFNQTTQSSTTLLWASHTTSSGINIKQFLSAATSGSSLILQDKNDNTNYIKFNVTGAPVDKTTYWEFAVAVTASGGNLPNAAILAAVTAAASSGGGAPVDAEYITSSSNSTLTAERMLTNTATVTWDFATAGQAKAVRAALTGDVTASADSNATTIANGAVTLAKQANVTAPMIRGRATAGTGSLEDLTPTQTTAMLDVFTSALNGLAPASGGGTTNFLRADGTWNAPAGGAAALPGARVLIQSQTVSAAVASVDFTTGIDGTYDEYELHFCDVLTATASVAILGLRVSSNAGSTWDAGASDYQFASRTVFAGTTGSVDCCSAAATYIFLSYHAGESTLAMSGIIHFDYPSSAARWKNFRFQTQGHHNPQGLCSVVGAGWRITTTAINGIRFLDINTSSNFTAGTFNLYGIKK